MGKYKFIIRTHYAVAVECEAETLKEASEKVRNKWCNRQIEERDDNNYDTEIVADDEWDVPDYTISVQGSVTEL